MKIILRQTSWFRKILDRCPKTPKETLMGYFCEGVGMKHRWIRWDYNGSMNTASHDNWPLLLFIVMRNKHPMLSFPFTVPRLGDLCFLLVHCSEVLKATINCRIKWPNWPWYSSFNKDKYIQFCLNPRRSVLMNASISAKLGLNINNNASYLPRSTEKACPPLTACLQCWKTVRHTLSALRNEFKEYGRWSYFYRNRFGLVMLCA